MVIIQTNMNFKDFQSLIYEVDGLTWDEFKHHILKNIDYKKYIKGSSMQFGQTTCRKRSVDKILVNDEFHLGVRYDNKSRSGFYLMKNYIEDI